MHLVRIANNSSQLGRGYFARIFLPIMDLGVLAYGHGTENVIAQRTTGNSRLPSLRMRRVNLWFKTWRKRGSSARQGMETI
jgi:hypothetical protein